MNGPNAPTPKASKLLRPRDVALYFSASNSSVRRWADQGVLHTVQTPGGHIRFPVAKFHQYINACEPTAVPAAHATPPTPPTTDTTGPQLPPLTETPSLLKVMIVECAPGGPSILTALLENNKVRVLTCPSMSAALEAQAANPHPNILADADLPGMDGREFICAIKRVCRSSKVMLMSAGRAYQPSEFQGYGALDVLSPTRGLIEMYRRVQDLTTERRASTRLRMGLPLVINRHDRGVTLDISADGALFAADRRHQRLLVELRLLDQRGAVVLTTTGHIVRSEQQDKKYLTAVRFNTHVGCRLGALVRNGVISPEFN